MKARNKKIDFAVILLVIIFLILIVTVLWIYFSTRTDPLSQTLENEEEINVAFIFHDSGEYLFSEVLLYNSHTNKAALLDIQGNVGGIIQSIERVDRIDTVYEQGNWEAFLQEAQELAGITIPYQIEIDINDLTGIVDLLEGFELFVTNPIEVYNDDEIFLIPSGNTVLDGAKIYQYLRYQRENEPDTERVGRRQKVVQSLLQRVGERSSFLIHDDVFPYFRSALHSNITDSGFHAFVSELQELDSERIVFQRVRGTYRNVDGQELLFPHYDGELLKRTIDQTIATLSNTEIMTEEELVISIQVLNGTNESGLAGRTAQLFQNFGLEIENIGNAQRSDAEYTRVIDRRGNILNAQRVAEIISCARVNTEYDEDVNSAVDVTVILGADFDGRYCRY
ncbi:MAG: LCP family protein [Spirochaetia bacterium]